MAKKQKHFNPLLYLYSRRVVCARFTALNRPTGRRPADQSPSAGAAGAAPHRRLVAFLRPPRIIPLGVSDPHSSQSAPPAPAFVI
ncbi:hypothetical protein EJB05_27417, partial [Eragrostis curvula]